MVHVIASMVHVTNLTPGSECNPGFGTCERKNRDKIYISQAHVKSMFGMHSPGPAIVPRVESLGKQMDSRKKSNGSVKFGSAPRFTYHTFGKAGQPGPGQYGVQ
jgi:hypothetical protein